MALVEDVAGRHGGIVEPARHCPQRRLRHDERVVGDDEARVPGGAHVLLDEAAAEMRARRMDAFAAPVGQRIDPAPPDQLGQPARKVTGGQVAGSGRRCPARDQHQRRRRVSPARRDRARRVLVIQQAQEILAPLADDDAAALLRRFRVEPVEFVVDLALQVARVGREPYRALVLLGPQAGRRDIAEGFSDAGPGLGQDGARRVGTLARREGSGDGGGVIGLFRPRLGIGPEQRGEAPPRFIRRHRVVAGRRRRGALLPLRQVLPNAQSGSPSHGPRFGRRQGSEHRRAPAPAGALGDFGKGPALDRVVGAQFLQQRAGGIDQRHAGIGHRPRRREGECGGDPARCRDAENRWPHKGEEFEDVERREAGKVEPARDGPRMADDRRRAATSIIEPGVIEPCAHLFRRQRLDLAIGGQPQRFAKPRDQRRRARHRHAGGRQRGQRGTSRVSGVRLRPDQRLR